MPLSIIFQFSVQNFLQIAMDLYKLYYSMLTAVAFSSQLYVIGSLKMTWQTDLIIYRLELLEWHFIFRRLNYIVQNFLGDVVVVIIWELDLQLPVQSMPITTKVVSLNPVHGEVYSIQHYVIKFVRDLRQDGGFLWVLRFPSPIKLTATILLNYCWKCR